MSQPPDPISPELISPELISPDLPEDVPTSGAAAAASRATETVPAAETLLAAETLPATEGAARTAGRPWPAPDEDADWWRGEVAGQETDSGAGIAVSVAAASLGPVDEPPAAPLGPFDGPPVARPGAARRVVFDVPAAPPAAAPVAVVQGFPFWDDTDSLPVVVPAATPNRAELRRAPHAAVLPRRRPRRQLRRAWPALPLLVVLAFASAFFSWVSAEPFWLSMGHGSQGTATVIADPPTPTGPDVASGSGSGASRVAALFDIPSRRCRASFTAEGGTFVVSTVDLLGVAQSACTAGAQVTAQMVSARAGRAYAVDSRGLTVRWAAGFVLVLLCALIIVWVSGAARFTGWRRVAAVALSLLTPATLTLGMLAAAF